MGWKLVAVDGRRAAGIRLGRLLQRDVLFFLLAAESSA
jgi:hypothetical protein